ncbi:omega-amidase NIT2 [Coccinella septempunctata]|uniref:omega-amidase NIT2 n=1 Tax=Coccinella septempunctata TaxID=41139 RepID=UPI001D06EDEB|nr:omega-amidase NIT2 [Coccinella septempunctata]
MLISKLFRSAEVTFNRIFKRNIETMSTKIKVALIQCNVGKNREENLNNASVLIERAKNNGAELVALPECFNSPYGTNFFKDYAESIPNGPSCEMLSKNAKKHNIYLVGGTIPETDDGKVYNTCTVWNPDGKLIAKYRKMHLFDIDIPGGITFKESDILRPGNNLETFNIKDIKFGLGICYDMRFEELAKLYRLEGCRVLLYPGAFNMTTGPLHWELIQRARANDNQVYVFAVSPARGTKGYICWGHSQITDPWGKVIAAAGHEEEIIYADIDADECDKVRQQIPVGVQRRVDIYDTVNICKSKI